METVAGRGKDGRSPACKHWIQLDVENERADEGQDGTVEPNSRGYISRQIRTRKIIFPCSADHEQAMQLHFR